MAILRNKNSTKRQNIMKRQIRNYSLLLKGCLFGKKKKQKM